MKIPMTGRQGRLRIPRWLFAVVCLLPMCAAGAATLSAAAAASSTNSVLRLINRDIFRFEAPYGLFSPEQRREAFETLIQDAMDDDSLGQVTTQLSETNAIILIDEKVVAILTPEDVKSIKGESLGSLANRFASRLQLAVTEAKELGDHRQLARSGLAVGGATALLVLVIMFWVRKRADLEDWLIRAGVKATSEVKSGTIKTLSRQNLVGTVRALVGVLMWTTIVVGGFLWLEFTLKAFPITRPVGEQLGREVIGALLGMGHSLIRSLPDTGVLVVIWLLARFVSASVRRFFYAAEKGYFRSQLFDAATAPMTCRLVVVLVWLGAIIIAFPYIPGSDTEAFKGVSVLAGLMVSLGSGSIVGQVVAGLVAVYTRAARPGDYVRIGESEGTIEKIGLFNTTIRTPKSEQAHLPNTLLTSTRTLNYSKRAEADTLWLYTEVTIGYDAPWRQVHAMLAEAANRTTGLSKDPAPFVMQMGLEDFYPRYQLNAAIEDPATRLQVLSDLHANIQDVFNEHEVQIMSPNYRGDPPAKIYVPKERWFTPPARQASAPETPAPAKPEDGATPPAQ